MAQRTFTKCGFERVNKAVNGRHMAFARFECHGCHKRHLDIAIASTIAPELMAKTARRQGWEADAQSASLCRCPDCIAARKAKQKGESPKDKVVLRDLKDLGAVTTLPKPLAAVIQSVGVLDLTPPISPETKVLAAVDAGLLHPEPAAVIPSADDEDHNDLLKLSHSSKPSPASAFNTETRLQVLEWLTEFFDVAKGRYTQGYSDEKVASDINVETRLVTGLREAAYGPLNPVDVEALERERADCRAEIDTVTRPWARANGGPDRQPDAGAHRRDRERPWQRQRALSGTTSSPGRWDRRSGQLAASEV